MRFKAVGRAAFALLALSAVPASAADKIGSAVRIVNKVTGEIDQQQRQLKTDDAVNQNEAIEVSSDSLGELKLNDDTKLALGPGARLVLDKFVYDPAPSTGTVSVNLLTGAFRFITGLSRKGNYQLRTPSASITVRGTIFDVYVDGAGGTWLLLLEGSVRVCNAANQCADVNNPCGVVHITPTGTLDGPIGWPAEARPINFATAFPFVVTPPSIDATPLFTRTAVELNQCAPKQPPAQRAEAPPSPPSPPTTPSPPQQSYAPPPPSYESADASPAPYTPPPVLVRNFDGAYVGINIGYGFSTSDTNVGCVSPPGAFSFSANCYEAIVGGAFVTGYNPSPNGVTGGLLAGYDFRFTDIVLGFVADMSVSGITGSASAYTAVPTFTPELSRVEQNIQWLGTLRSRLGFVSDNMLFYVTGGLAYAQVETSYDLSLPPVPLVSAASSQDWEVGYTLGLGGEVSFGFFTISVEYLFYDLGSRTLNPIAVVNGVPQTTTFFPTRFDLDGHLFRIGTNFPLN